MKIAIYLAVLVFFGTANAEHSSHNYMGSHGMALFGSSDGGLFAHHLPLYSKPHDYQIIYKVRLEKEIEPVLTQNALVTLLPENFDLKKLVNGESLNLSAIVFAGHFERGGKEAFHTQIEFVEPVLVRELSDLNSATTMATFKHISLGDNSNLVVHLIGAAPSFDTVAWLPDSQKTTSGDITRCSVSASPLKSEAEIAGLIQSCFGVSPAYVEYRDFQ